MNPDDPESRNMLLLRARRVIASLEAENRGLRRELDSLRDQLQPHGSLASHGEDEFEIHYPPGVPAPEERR